MTTICWGTDNENTREFSSRPATRATPGREILQNLQKKSQQFPWVKKTGWLAEQLSLQMNSSAHLIKINFKEKSKPRIVYTYQFVEKEHISAN